MRGAIKALLLLSLLTACGSQPVEDRRIVNERFFGTVVSAARVNDVNWNGAGDRAATSAGNVARINAGMGASSVTSAVDSRLGTPGMLGSLTGVFASPFLSPSTSNAEVYESYIAYVIETEEGRRMNVTASDRRIYYPGDEVLVVRNQRGYSEVFPRDLSGRYPGGL